MSPEPEFRLGELAGLGPYFALGTAGPAAANEAAGPGGWRPVSGLISDGPELSRVVGEFARRLGTAERWIAASVFYQGWAARLTSIYAGSVVLRSAVPDLAGECLSYWLPDSGPAGLLAAPLTAAEPGAAWRRLTEDHLEPLAAALRRQVRVGEHLLRGNLASALAGSVTVLSLRGHGTLAELTGQNWAQPAGLARYGRWRAGPDGLRYCRTTCCGFDQVPGGGQCADCSLAWRGER